jgi:hypothetical protein
MRNNRKNFPFKKEMYVKNPKTKRYIVVGGTLYQKLKAAGVRFGQAVLRKPAAKSKSKSKSKKGKKKQTKITRYFKKTK